MKIEITDTPPPKKPELQFPVLMKHVRSGSIVWFSAPTVGTCMFNPSGNLKQVEGRCDSDWVGCSDTSEWTPFTGTVTLSND